MTDHLQEFELNSKSGLEEIGNHCLAAIYLFLQLRVHIGYIGVYKKKVKSDDIL